MYISIMCRVMRIIRDKINDIVYKFGFSLDFSLQALEPELLQYKCILLDNDEHFMENVSVIY